jgi:hypothetical protein
MLASDGLTKYTAGASDIDSLSVFNLKPINKPYKKDDSVPKGAE